MRNHNTEATFEVRHVSKHFGRVQALDDVSLSFRRGEIHTLLGENGAGKTTLMNVLYGLYQKDSGEILLEGKPCDIRDPRDSQQLGIGMVPQTFKLIPDMNVWENVLLFMKGTGFFLQKEPLKQAIAQNSRLFGFGMEEKLDVEIENLSEGEKQKVEILKLLACGSRIMLFDEATNVLAPNELSAFLKVIQEMNRQGYTIIYITHRLQEALEISHRISVFRKGKLVGTIDAAEATLNKLTTMMVGAEFDRTYVRQRERQEKKILSVANLNANDDRDFHVLRDISFELHEGEIVGLAGIEGNGSAQLAEAIVGLREARGGSIHYGAEDITELSAAERMTRGICFLPSGNSLVPLFCIRKNSILDYPGNSPFSRRGILSWPDICSHAQKIVATYQVQTPDIYLQAAKLSGGNKQRLSLGRKIESNPRLLIANHPTKGLDISSQNFIYERLSLLRDRGSTILFIGTDLDELFRICDRLLVIYRGEIVGCFDDLSKVSKLDLGVLMTGGASYIDNAEKRRQK
jgi:simple sugar transport system ATP-binding protein